MSREVTHPPGATQDNDDVSMRSGRGEWGNGSSGGSGVAEDSVATAMEERHSAVVRWLEREEKNEREQGTGKVGEEALDGVRKLLEDSEYLLSQWQHESHARSEAQRIIHDSSQEVQRLAEDLRDAENRAQREMLRADRAESHAADLQARVDTLETEAALLQRRCDRAEALASATEEEDPSSVGDDAGSIFREAAERARRLRDSDADASVDVASESAMEARVRRLTEERDAALRRARERDHHVAFLAQRWRHSLRQEQTQSKSPVTQLYARTRSDSNVLRGVVGEATRHSVLHRVAESHPTGVTAEPALWRALYHALDQWSLTYAMRPMVPLETLEHAMFEWRRVWCRHHAVVADEQRPDGGYNGDDGDRGNGDEGEATGSSWLAWFNCYGPRESAPFSAGGKFSQHSMHPSHTFLAVALARRGARGPAVETSPEPESSSSSTEEEEGEGGLGREGEQEKRRVAIGARAEPSDSLPMLLASIRLWENIRKPSADETAGWKRARRFLVRVMSWVWEEIARAMTIAHLVASDSGTPSTPFPWMPDASSECCGTCHAPFHCLLRRRHHCRCCGQVMCASCCDTVALDRYGVPAADPTHTLTRREAESVAHSESDSGTHSTGQLFTGPVWICRNCSPLILRLDPVEA